MTSLLPEEESNLPRFKHRSQTHNAHVKICSASNHPPTTEDEAASASRAFLRFSRENLSISHSDLEQGFNKSRGGLLRLHCCVSRQTLLSCAALLLALGCAALELWKLRRVLANARDIEALRRDVETLKHRFVEQDLLDELRAFEEQLYSEGASEDEDLSSSMSSSANDYDSSYDESPLASSSSSDYRTVTLKPDHLLGSTTAASSSSSSSSSTRSDIGSSHPAATTTTTTTNAPCTSKDLEEVIAVLRRAESERHLQQRGLFEKSAREKERLVEAKERRRMLEGHRSERRRRRATTSRLERRDRYFTKIKDSTK